ncbi:hypothetical protein EJB05_57539 [Eragrostis curvula]|uniref:RING-type E3 ubiquitin transferase n=1 Tax=Eragrostis curvula TaxID=38414 RepID=A0A5J9SDL6_9POAL|nr:hypothetical protein EJB05_57539 [Eragrostis curvula]
MPPVLSLVERREPAMNATSGDGGGGFHRTQQRHGHEGLGTVPIVCIVLACVAVAVGGGVVCFLCKRKKRRRAAREREVAARIAREEIPHGRERQERTGGDPTGIVIEQQAGTGAGGRHDGLSSSEANVLDRSGAIAHSDDNGGCPMCRSAFGIEAGKLPMRLDCGHLFHHRCIRPWVKVNKSCPVCNSNQITFLGLGQEEESSSRDAVRSSFHL